MSAKKSPHSDAKGAAKAYDKAGQRAKGKGDKKTDRPAPTLQARLDEIFQPFARSDAPGLVVGVAHRGQPIYRRGFGLACVALGVANTSATRMRIGSTSKHFTCLAALLLAEEGKLDVDAGIRRYVPELPARGSDPTLRQLMNHSGGLRCYLDLGFFASGTRIKPLGDALASQVRQSRANFAPGEKTIYCNGGYHLLSIAIERVAKMPFEQFLRERIFVPLGMHDTESVPNDLDLQARMATLHVPRPGGGWRRGVFPTEEVRGEGAMVSTVGDMLTWMAHLRGNKRIGSEASWAQMRTPVTLTNGSTVPYALGLMVERYRGVDVLHHAGGVIGGSAQMITVPAHELDVIIIVNGAPANPVKLAEQVIDTVLGNEVLAPAPKLPKAAQFKPMLGTRYHDREAGLVLGFGEAEEGGLGLAFLNMPPVQARPTGRGKWFEVDFSNMATGPIAVPADALAGKGGRPPRAITVREAGREARWVRLPAKPPATARAGAPLVGRYRVADLGADAVVRLDGDKLTLEVQGRYGPNPMILTAWSADVFALQFADVAMPVGAVATVQRDGAGAVKSLRIDSWRTRSLEFVRLGRTGR